MRVTNFTIRKGSKTIEYSAEFIFEKPFRKKHIPGYLRRRIFGKNEAHRFRVWYRVPIEFVSNPQYEEAFYIAALPLALTLKENLFFEGTISQTLHANSESIRNYYGFQKNTISVKTGSNKKKFSSNRSVAQLFTLGVDSFYTFFSTLKQQKRPRYLVYIDGFDLPLSSLILGEVHDRISKIAKEFKLQTVFIQTNIRDISDQISDWYLYHGPALASAALFLSPKIKRLYFNSSDIHKTGVISGTSKIIDPLWSTDYFQYASIGTNITRFGKIQYLVHHSMFPMVARNLRVCFKTYYLTDTTYNCGNCEKCFRNWYSFMICKPKEKLTTLTNMNFDFIKNMHILDHDKHHWLNIYHEALKARMDKSFIDPIRQALLKNGVLL